MPGVGEIIAGKYRIDQLLGEGGMGAVYAATHQLTGKRVALKWMLPALTKDAEAVGRFMREAQAAGRVSHPNVVDVYDVGQHGESMFLVMELLRGEPLSALLDRGPLPLAEAVKTLLPAFRGVAAAHDQGVVHRDLKPDNIFLCCDHDGTRHEAKVLDFGISKLTTKHGEANLHLTRTGSVMGTPYYMAPEQIQGIKNVDARTDIYALGVILYQALTGALPFNAETYHALIVEIATGTPAPLRKHRPNLPAEAERIVMKTLSRDPSKRFQSVRELSAALEPLADAAATTGEISRGNKLSSQSWADGAKRPATAPTLTPFTSDAPSQRNSTVRRSFAVWGIAGLLVLTGIGGGGYLALANRTNGAASRPSSNVARPPAHPEVLQIEAAPPTAPAAPPTVASSRPPTQPEIPVGAPTPPPLLDGVGSTTGALPHETGTRMHTAHRADPPTRATPPTERPVEPTQRPARPPPGSRTKVRLSTDQF